MVLPAPQVSDSEFNEVVKYGLVSEGARSMVTGSGVMSSQQLLNDYSLTPVNNPIHGSLTPRTPATQDTLMQVKCVCCDVYKIINQLVFFSL